MIDLLAHAEDCIDRCRALARYSEEPGFTTRTFLSEPMRQLHAEVGQWMRDAALEVSIDAAGNIRGANLGHGAPLFIGSHLDTVPHAGAFDGILGVVLGIKLMQLMHSNLAVEVIGFSEEEGVRFGFPFIGSRALVGTLDARLLAVEDAAGISVSQAITNFGLNPDDLPSAIVRESRGYLEIHIEQGPVLESRNAPLGIVEAIAGQTRMDVTFEGQAGHAGTTPMHLRKDALAGAAEWICAVETEAKAIPELVATVGRIEASPGASNVIPERVKLSLDVRHRDDSVRRQSVEVIALSAAGIAHRRTLHVDSELRLDQPAVALDERRTEILAASVEHCGHPVHRLVSGAGHDAMVLAPRMPAAMLFVRSPRGLSHHPDETVLPEDVAAALSVGLHFLESTA